MQEVTYHNSTGLSTRIGLYENNSLKYVDAEAKEISKYEFGTRDYNPYDRHNICKNHCARVYYPWIHGAFHWANEDPWRYCYNHSKLNEPVNIATKWKASLQAITSHEATTIETISNKLMQDKGKRKIFENPKADQSYKFKEVPLIEKEALESEAKRKECIKRA